MVRVRRIALLGYPAVGKSSLAYQFVEKRFSDNYCTTIENHLTHEIPVDGQLYEVHLFDTMGMTELPMLSEQTFTMDGWVLVFSVENNRSFGVIRDIYDALCVQIPKPTIILVGNKTDLGEKREVTKDEGKQLAASLSASYMETSAKDDQGVSDVFVQIVKEINKTQGVQGRDPEKGCSIL
eukprot:m.97885 g.97885  ORF g.97885 m.97885 type:complete len:181 (-) comp13615_c2_seq1:3244-3786(-)